MDKSLNVLFEKFKCVIILLVEFCDDCVVKLDYSLYIITSYVENNLHKIYNEFIETIYVIKRETLTYLTDFNSNYLHLLTDTSKQYNKCIVKALEHIVASDDTTKKDLHTIFKKLFKICKKIETL